MIITISKLVSGGQGLGRDSDGRAVFVWNALPGETVDVRIIKKKKEYLEGVAENILVPSPDRIEPKDTHFLSTAPWDMMTIERETREKKLAALETYGRIGELILSESNIALVSGDTAYGYRNKMEFSFAEQDGALSLAFFARGGKTHIPAVGSSLCDPEINRIAADILRWMNAQHIPIRSAKTMIVRTNGNGACIAGVFLKDRLSFSNYPPLQNGLIGFQLFYSTHKSPASVPTDLLYAAGESSLTADMLGTTLRFGLFSFFQINIPVFALALKDIAAFLDPKEPITDLYSGVGAISLPLAQNRSETVLVEIGEEAVRYANENILLNHIQNATAMCMPAEKITECIVPNRAVIVDPPRAGLHQKVTNRLLAARPPKIIYLSCDIATQARDIRMLGDVYRPTFVRLYNFFPRTPHVEGLVVLERL